MKKNVMMRIASILLVCVLATTCGISGTFAKYVTKSTMNDEARVAYWGFQELASQTFELFNSGDTNIKSNGNGLLAPGSYGSAAFKFIYVDGNGGAIQAPEVAYTFKIEVSGTFDTDALDDNPNFIWVLDGKGYKTFGELKTAIEALDGDETFDPGELPTLFYTAGNDAATHVIGWQWMFDQATGTMPLATEYADGTAIIIAENDVGDTMMGNASDLDDIAITITITATQVD